MNILDRALLAMYDVCSRSDIPRLLAITLHSILTAFVIASRGEHAAGCRDVVGDFNNDESKQIVGLAVGVFVTMMVELYWIYVTFSRRIIGEVDRFPIWTCISTMTHVVGSILLMFYEYGMWCLSSYNYISLSTSFVPFGLELLFRYFEPIIQGIEWMPADDSDDD